MTLAYRVKLQEDDNGTLLVTCRALPEVTTFGDDEAAAMARARDAIEEALAARIGDGQDIPKSDAKGPHLVRLPALTTLKVELYRQLRLAGLRGPNWPGGCIGIANPWIGCKNSNGRDAAPARPAHPESVNHSSCRSTAAERPASSSRAGRRLPRPSGTD